MAATAAQRARLRRMCSLAEDDAIYGNDTLDLYIEEYPLVDAAGLESDDDDWAPTYNLYAAAVDVWLELAAAVAEKYDHTDNQGSFNMSQQQRNYLGQVERYRALADLQIPFFPE